MDFLSSVFKSYKHEQPEKPQTPLNSADKRTAELIIDSMELGEDMVYKLDMTHEDISDRIGVSRTTVSKILEKLEDNGWIEIGYGSIRVIKPHILREYCLAEEYDN